MTIDEITFTLEDLLLDKRVESPEIIAAVGPPAID